MTATELEFILEAHAANYPAAAELIRAAAIQLRKSTSEKRLEGMRDHELKFLLAAKRLGFDEADEAIKAQLERMRRRATAVDAALGGSSAIEMR